MAIESTIKNNPGAPNEYLVKVLLDQVFFDQLTAGEIVGLGKRIANILADKMYPEVESLILSNPKFQDQIISDVLIRIANRLSDKGLIKDDEVKDGTNE